MNSAHHETFLTGPNQAGGKSTALNMLLSIHATGNYSRGWNGPVSEEPVDMAVGGYSATTTRDLITDRLLGPHGERGIGFLPREAVSEDWITYTRGPVAHQIDYFKVPHRSGGMSRVFAFSHKAGWQRFAGYKLWLVGLDEEPENFMVYDELTARLTFTNGYLYLATTPLLGETELFLLFENDDTGLRRMIHYDIDDCTHLSEEERERIKKKWKDNPMESARLHGMPVRGRGMIFRTSNEVILCEDFRIPDHWPQVIGLDFPHTTGKFAAVKMALNPDDDCVYLVDTYKAENMPPGVHFTRVAQMGGRVLACAWPHDGGRKMEHGGQIAKTYADLGLNMMQAPATVRTQDGKKSFAKMPIIEDICARMADGRFKAFRTASEDFFEEKRRYRMDGFKVREGLEDHIIDAIIKCMMVIKGIEQSDDSKTSEQMLTRLGRELNFYEM